MSKQSKVEELKDSLYELIQNESELECILILGKIEELIQAVREEERDKSSFLANKVDNNGHESIEAQSDSEPYLLQEIVTGEFKKELHVKDGGIWFLTDSELELWESDGSIKEGDKLYGKVLIKEYVPKPPKEK